MAGCSQLDAEDVVSNLFESNAAGRTNASFEGHCVMTNAEDVNEVQQNVAIVKKGKKRAIETVSDKEVAQRNRERIPVTGKQPGLAVISNFDFLCNLLY